MITIIEMTRDPGEIRLNQGSALHYEGQLKIFKMHTSQPLLIKEEKDGGFLLYKLLSINQRNSFTQITNLIDSHDENGILLGFFRCTCAIEIPLQPATNN